MKTICILDYGLGNVRSVSNALSVIGSRPVVSKDDAILAKSDGMIIPGVGSFPQAMACLEQNGLIGPVKDYIASGRTVLGICLGMQILFDSGAEFQKSDGLGCVRGSVERLPVAKSEGRLPHIAWTRVDAAGDGSAALFDGIGRDSRIFYFVHSFAATEVPEEFVAGRSSYCGHTFVSAIRKANVWGTQFHPEKSGPNGLRLLSNFVAQC